MRLQGLLQRTHTYAQSRCHRTDVPFSSDGIFNRCEDRKESFGRFYPALDRLQIGARKRFFDIVLYQRQAGVKRAQKSVEPLFRRERVRVVPFRQTGDSHFKPLSRQDVKTANVAVRPAPSAS